MMKFSALASSFLTAAVLFAACGCSAAGSRPAGTSAGSRPAGTSTGSRPVTGLQHCLDAGLRLTTVRATGKAGNGVYWHLTLTNTSGVTCTLDGYPQVSFLSTAHSPLTADATRVPASARQITLAPGQSASAQLKTPDAASLSRTACHQSTTGSLAVNSPGDDLYSLFSFTHIGVCAGSGPGGSVWPVVPGHQPGV